MGTERTQGAAYFFIRAKWVGSVLNDYDGACKAFERSGEGPFVHTPFQWNTHEYDFFWCEVAPGGAFGCNDGANRFCNQNVRCEIVSAPCGFCNFFDDISVALTSLLMCVVLRFDRFKLIGNCALKTFDPFTVTGAVAGEKIRVACFHALTIPYERFAVYCFAKQVLPACSNPGSIQLPAEVTPRKKPTCWVSCFRGDLTENRTPIARMRTLCPNR